VDNALRYGKAASGHRSFSRSRRAAGEGVLEVEDSGPGIPVAERERVFDRFYRGEGAAEGGTGLGLAIVRRIAQRHGGRVELLEGTGGKGLLGEGLSALKRPLKSPLPRLFSIAPIGGCLHRSEQS
jgi:signal transduction histidine kinase